MQYPNTRFPEKSFSGVHAARFVFSAYAVPALFLKKSLFFLKNIV